MKSIGLSDSEVVQIQKVMQQFPAVKTAILYGSRAKGNYCPQSDIDLALTGSVTPLQAAAIAAELDDLPLPYQFDVPAYEAIQNHALLAHIQRAGIHIYSQN